MKKKAEKLAFHYIFLIYGFEPYIGHVAMGFLNLQSQNKSTNKTDYSLENVID